jgi:hypothetical protein
MQGAQRIANRLEHRRIILGVVVQLKEEQPTKLVSCDVASFSRRLIPVHFKTLTP